MVSNEPFPRELILEISHSLMGTVNCPQDGRKSIITKPHFYKHAILFWLFRPNRPSNGVMLIPSLLVTPRWLWCVCYADCHQHQPGLCVSPEFTAPHTPLSPHCNTPHLPASPHSARLVFVVIKHTETFFYELPDARNGLVWCDVGSFLPEHCNILSTSQSCSISIPMQYIAMHR